MMKNIFCAIMVLVVFTACTKRNEKSTVPLDEKVPETVSASAKLMGDFMNGSHRTVTGTASVYLQSGRYILTLGNVAISSGPDLHIYISKEIQPVNFIDLGKLKSKAGNQAYDIAGEPDFSAYKYVLIHCQQYNHLFGRAELK